MNKTDAFKKELSYILNSKYLENAKKLIEILPDYFFEVPASSTGKYHPKFSLGDGGLVRHTKVAVRISYELLSDESIGNVFTNDEKDLMLVALILHDGCKSGLTKTQYTVVNHPLIVSKLIKDNKNLLTLTEGELEFLCSCIETHMGPWNKDFKGNTVLQVPKNKYQKFVHMCDFLSSKKFLDVKFVNNEISED